ncbi:EAL domain-containing protein [Thalassotalea profundi]|uniref:cyclic-guanylate-specific phosphodiesterase n=1 Tax=Thalassotalea profundi TaxID=2036687 RepID=A0ABQ3ISC8_9GAMM|nr:EAL domain-containing protein [Thalassotalea profundi]GHE91042.1 hypothetical protein GCM10011501_20600 [Thalassotalea profundi]
MLSNSNIRKPLSFFVGMLVSLIVIYVLYSSFLINKLTLVGERLFLDLENTISQSYNVVDRLNNLGFSQCSKANLFNMRKEQFNSNDIKDIGFFKDGFLVCTTGAGILEKPIKESEPNLIINGYSIWVNKALKTFESKISGVLIQKGNYNVVLSFEGILKEHDKNIQYQIVARKNGQISHLYGVNNLFQNNANSTEVVTSSGFLSHSIELCGNQGNVCLAVSQRNYIEFNDVPSLFIFLVIIIMFFSGVSSIHLFELYYQYLRSTKRRVRRGIKNNRFIPYYQAIIELKSGKVIGCELLARFEDNMGALYPDEFIPVVSDLNKSWEMTECLINKSLEDFKLLTSKDGPFYLSINIFPKDVNNGNILKSSNLLGDINKNLQICFEITEDEELNFSGLDKVLNLLGENNIKVSIDDFGTGYSNLSQLKLLKIDTLKIDKSFIDEVETGSIRSTLIPNIVAIANKLNANIIAEGVENQLQVDELMKMNIEFCQGWHYVKALPIKDFKTYLLVNSKFDFFKR